MSQCTFEKPCSLCVVTVVSGLQHAIKFSVGCTNPHLSNEAANKQGQAAWQASVSGVLGNRSASAENINGGDLRLLIAAVSRKCLEITDGPAREPAESDWDSKL